MGPLPPQPPRTRDTRVRDRWIVGGVSAVAIAVVVALVAVPVAQSSTVRYGAIGAGTGTVYVSDSFAVSLCPAGSNARVAFASSELNLSVRLVASNGTTVGSGSGANGSLTLHIANCGQYQVDVSGQGQGEYSVSVTLSFRAPLL
jgi:hypothetical protein